MLKKLFTLILLSILSANTLADTQLCYQEARFPSKEELEPIDITDYESQKFVYESLYEDALADPNNRFAKYKFCELLAELNPKPCNIKQSKSISFRSKKSQDILNISLIGKSCQYAEKTVSVTSLDGGILYEHKSKLRHAIKSFDADGLVNKIINSAMTTTKTLPTKFGCSQNGDKCIPYEGATVTLKRYKELRDENIPMLNHSTYYEGWASVVYDDTKKTGVIIFQGGL